MTYRDDNGGDFIAPFAKTNPMREKTSGANRAPGHKVNVTTPASKKISVDGPSNKDIIVSLHDDRYKNILMPYFKVLGEEKSNERANEIGIKLFNDMKRSGARFFNLRKLKDNDKLHTTYKVINDDMALKSECR